MLNLFPHLTSLQQLFQICEILNLSWIIQVLAGVTSRSNLRVRLRRRPTENPQVQDGIKNKTCNELFIPSIVKLKIILQLDKLLNFML